MNSKWTHGGVTQTRIPFASLCSSWMSSFSPASLGKCSRPRLLRVLGLPPYVKSRAASRSRRLTHAPWRRRSVGPSLLACRSSTISMTWRGRALIEWRSDQHWPDWDFRRDGTVQTDGERVQTDVASWTDSVVCLWWCFEWASVNANALSRAVGLGHSAEPSLILFALSPYFLGAPSPFKLVSPFLLDYGSTMKWLNMSSYSCWVNGGVCPDCNMQRARKQCVLQGIWGFGTLNLSSWSSLTPRR